MKKYLLCLFLISSHCIAEEKLFQNYIDPYSKMTSACGSAYDSLSPVSLGTTCTLLVRMPLYQKPGANLIRLAKEKHYRPIYFWVEQRIENGRGDTWKKVSGIKQYRYNDIYQPITFTPSKTAIFRIAVDYLGQKAFADTYGYKQYKVVVK